MATTHSIRYRINVSTNLKGQKTYECTVDAEGFTEAQVLCMSDCLVEDFDKRYPPPVIEKPEAIKVTKGTGTLIEPVASSPS